MRIFLGVFRGFCLVNSLYDAMVVGTDGESSWLQYGFCLTGLSNFIEALAALHVSSKNVINLQI
jgi:hypothetical protein